MYSDFFGDCRFFFSLECSLFMNIAVRNKVDKAVLIDKYLECWCVLDMHSDDTRTYIRFYTCMQGAVYILERVIF